MFSGIVEAQGRVRALRKKGKAARLELRVPAAYARLKKGDSVAVDGVCLTVVARGRGRLSFDVVAETLRRTRLGRLEEGERVNLERPLRWRGRVHGHLVQGHIDAVVKVLKKDSHSFEVAYPKRVRQWVAPKGSVALNGISLTVGRVSGASFRVHGIPHTLKSTNMGLWKAGTALNLEADLWLKARFR